MRIKQLGNGSAFNPNKTNTSFLIEYNKYEYILFDCGYNVFKKLKKLGDEYIKRIKYIYISHLDDDHIGSLKSLIYYRYYVLNLETCLIDTKNEVSKQLIKQFKNFNKTFTDCKEKEAKIISFKDIKNINDYNLEYVNTYHHIDCQGLLMYNSNSILYITGDTKVCDSTIKTLKLISKSNKSYKIFHDFSNFDSPCNNTHTCKTDFHNNYDDLISKGLIIYKCHNDEKYNKKWIKI